MLGKVGDPARQWEREMDSWHQTEEEVRRSQDAGRLGERAWHNIKPALCTEYISYVQHVYNPLYIQTIVIVNYVLLCLSVSGE